MATVTENQKRLHWPTILSSFVACLVLFILLMELLARLSVFTANLHSVTVPLLQSEASISVETETPTPETSAIVQDKIFTDSTSPFSQNRLAAPAIDQKVRALFALVVNDYGLSNTQTQIVRQTLPEYTTVLLSPYVPNQAQVVEQAKSEDMEVWGAIDSNSLTGQNRTTGPLYISETQTRETKAKRIQSLLSDADNLTGFVLDNPNFDISNQFSQKGYGYYNLSSATIPVLKYGRYDRILADKSRLKDFLSQVFERSNGIIVMEPSPRLIEELPDLLESFSQAGIQIVPLSYFVDQ